MGLWVIGLWGCGCDCCSGGGGWIAVRKPLNKVSNLIWQRHPDSEVGTTSRGCHVLEAEARHSGSSFVAGNSTLGCRFSVGNVV